MTHVGPIDSKDWFKSSFSHYATALSAVIIHELAKLPKFGNLPGQTEKCIVKDLCFIGNLLFGYQHGVSCVTFKIDC